MLHTCLLQYIYIHILRIVIVLIIFLSFIICCHPAFKLPFVKGADCRFKKSRSHHLGKRGWLLYNWAMHMYGNKSCKPKWLHIK